MPKPQGYSLFKFVLPFEFYTLYTGHYIPQAIAILQSTRADQYADIHFPEI